MQLIGFQGDTVYFKVDSLPEKLTEDAQLKRGIIAQGSGSGHSHSFEHAERVALYRGEDGLLYADVREPTRVVHGRAPGFQGTEADHDYHNPVSLPAGIYAIGIVEEVDWLTKTIRRVVD